MKFCFVSSTLLTSYTQFACLFTHRGFSTYDAFGIAEKVEAYSQCDSFRNSFLSECHTTDFL
jgi:hypothetical protein